MLSNPGDGSEYCTPATTSGGAALVPVAGASSKAMAGTLFTTANYYQLLGGFEYFYFLPFPPYFLFGWLRTTRQQTMNDCVFACFMRHQPSMNHRTDTMKI